MFTDDIKPPEPVEIERIEDAHAVCFLFVAQISAIVGSGLLAQQTAALFGDSSKSVWFSSIISIYALALIPMVGQAADYFGRKWITVGLSVMAVVGPLVISRAQNMGTVIAGFNLLGPAMSAQATMYAIPSEIVPRRYRAIVQTVVNMSTGSGAVIAIMVGGALLRNNDLENYRIYWYVVAGLYALGSLGITIGYRPPPRELELTLTTLEKIRKLDFTGLFLIGSGLALFSMGLQWSGNPYNWRDAYVLGPFIIGILLIICFVIYSWRLRRDGFMHHDLFGDRNFALALVVIFLEGVVFFAANSYLAYEWSVLFHLDLLQSGYRFALAFVGSITFAPLAGLYTTRTKRLREPLVLGFVIFTITFALMAAIKASTPSWVSWVYSPLIGIGLGFILPTVYVAAQMSTPAAMISVTTSVATATRSLGGAVGLAINNALFTGTLNRKLPQNVAAAAAIRAVPGATPPILASAGSAYTQAYIESFRKAWIAAAAFSAVGIIFTVAFRNPKTAFSAKIDAPVEINVTTSEKVADA
ncbi:putative siderophore iron transporter [Ilyonectria destructans]|nr:putative siderophore iron transporter [Ilyonectria destructans]